jgi:hypothetical protein
MRVTACGTILPFVPRNIKHKSGQWRKIIVLQQSGLWSLATVGTYGN